MGEARPRWALVGVGRGRRGRLAPRATAARVAIVLVLGLGLAACSSNSGAQASGSTTTGAGAAGSTTTSPAASSTTTAPAGATTTVALPVVACPTTVGVATTTTVALPSGVTVSVPAGIAGQAPSLAAFADTQGILRVVAPRRWTCRAQVGADGSEAFDVVPPGTTIPTSGPLPAQGIVASETSACALCTLSQACPFFPAALSALHASYPSEQCASLSPEITVVRVSATEVRFSAPAGVTVLTTGTGATSGGGPYPVQGVMTWSPSNHGGAYTSICTLPASSASVCAASVTAFAADFPAG